MKKFIATLVAGVLLSMCANAKNYEYVTKIGYIDTFDDGTVIIGTYLGSKGNCAGDIFDMPLLITGDGAEKMLSIALSAQLANEDVTVRFSDSSNMAICALDSIMIGRTNRSKV